MAFLNKVSPLLLSSIDSATFTGSYQLLSASTGLDNAATILEIVNNSNRGVTVSFDGVNDHAFVRAATDRQWQFQTNSQQQNRSSVMPKGQLVYVKAAAGAGLVYLSGFYNQTNG